MIDNPNPESWQELQIKVCRIFQDIGFNAESNKTVTTPRGEIELDVFASDESNVDKIKYIVECKNWNKSIPQTVIHSFTTVMNETGGNVGYIISRKGMQKGALAFTKNTNITGLSYLDFQKKFFGIWFERYFVTTVGDAVDPLNSYTEPYSSYRDDKVSELSESDQNKFWYLYDKYMDIGMSLSYFMFAKYSKAYTVPIPENYNLFKEELNYELNGQFILKSQFYRDLHEELLCIIFSITNQFNSFWSTNIFDRYL